MAQVRAAPRVEHLDALVGRRVAHVAGVDALDDVLRVDGLEERRPARAGLVLGRRREEREPGDGADVVALGLALEVGRVAVLGQGQRRAYDVRDVSLPLRRRDVEDLVAHLYRYLRRE